MTAAVPVPGADGLCHGALQASGLPARILAALRAGGWATLGDLGRPLPAALPLDADDRALLARVAAYAGATCQGRPPALNLREWLALFLPPRLADAIELHFGLRDSAVALAPVRNNHSGCRAVSRPSRKIWAVSGDCAGRLTLIRKPLPASR